ncbi:GntR family transcriptional regulator [Paraglaciecola sp. 2405UD69-4]|uniref:GntR family transcriptional regulator n=1 Tax=Paraglaciecola sp. 2405UD69-4 TaxID=3391836 RepID=UPI0039C9366F
MSKTPSNTHKVSNAVSIYETIREEILTLELAPSSTIDENSMAKRFDVSRSPVREAFIRLAADGLIKTLPNKNSQVSPLALEDFPHFMDALDLVQRAVTRLAAANRTASDLQIIKDKNHTFKEAVRSHDVVAMIESNHAFHLAVSEASKNNYFTVMYKRLLDEGKRTLRIYYRLFNDKPPAEMVNNHDLIIEAIENQDTNLADQLAQQHANQLSDGFIAYLSQRQSQKITLK